MSRLYVLLFIIVISSAYPAQNLIAELTDSDLRNMTVVFPKLFVFYYVPWCDHSRKLTPIYEQLAQQLQDQGSPIKLAKINCDQNEKAYDFAQITRFPLLKYYSASEEIQFDGDRTLTYLYKWLTKRISFPIKPLDQHKLEALRKANSSQVSIVYYGSMRSARAAEFISMAYHDNYNHYYSFEQLIKPQGTFELLRSFDEDVSALLKTSQTETWIRQNDRPVIVPLDERSITHIFRDGNKGVFFFIDPLHIKVKQQYQRAVKEWNKREKREFEVTFIAIYQDDEDFFGLMEYLELHAVDRPVALVDGGQEVKYIMNVTVSNINSASILQFLETVQNAQIASSPLQIQSQASGLGCPFIATNETEGNPSDIHRHFVDGEDADKENQGDSLKQSVFSRRERSFTLTRQL